MTGYWIRWISGLAVPSPGSTDQASCQGNESAITVTGQREWLLCRDSAQENAPHALQLSASSPDEDLRHWCARSDGHRGLERFACRQYGSRRKDYVMNTRTAFFQEQERLRATGVPAMDVPEAVAKVSREKSRRARTFSLFMGEADAQVVTTGFAQPSPKRCKVAHSNALPSLTKANPACHAQSSVRRFPMDAPLLRSLA
jgi:hypothetical protein